MNDSSALRLSHRGGNSIIYVCHVGGRGCWSVKLWSGHTETNVPKAKHTECTKVQVCCLIFLQTKVCFLRNAIKLYLHTYIALLSVSLFKCFIKVWHRGFCTCSVLFYVKVLEQAWPFFGMYMEKFLKENIQPTVRLSSSALKTFTFVKIHFGHIVSLHFYSITSSCPPFLLWYF